MGYKNERNLKPRSSQDSIALTTVFFNIHFPLGNSPLRDYTKENFLQWDQISYRSASKEDLLSGICINKQTRRSQIYILGLDGEKVLHPFSKSQIIYSSRKIAYKRSLSHRQAKPNLNSQTSLKAIYAIRKETSILNDVLQLYPISQSHLAQKNTRQGLRPQRESV